MRRRRCRRSPRQGRGPDSVAPIRRSPPPRKTAPAPQTPRPTARSCARRALRFGSAPANAATASKSNVVASPLDTNQAVQVNAPKGPRVPQLPGLTGDPAGNAASPTAANATPARPQPRRGFSTRPILRPVPTVWSTQAPGADRYPNLLAAPARPGAIFLDGLPKIQKRRLFLRERFAFGSLTVSQIVLGAWGRYSAPSPPCAGVGVPTPGTR